MPMITDTSPIVFRDDLPASIDVIVIGAGVAGVSTALFLRERGVSVLVCEKGRVAGEQSSRNWGWVRQQGRDPAELPIMQESIRIWDGLAEACGEDLGFTRTGVLYIASSEKELAKFESWMKVAKEHQLDTRLLSKSEVEGLVAAPKGQWLGGLLTPSDGRAEPFKAVPALARACQRLGVTIAENCAVRGLDLQGGKVAGVVTEKGPIRCERVLLAGGAWSSLLLRSLGLDLPQLVVRETVARTAPAPEIFAGAAADEAIAFRRRQDGGYTLALADHAEHYVTADSLRYFTNFLPTLRRSWKMLNLRFSGSPMGGWLPERRWQPEETSPFERTRVLNPQPSPSALRRMRRRLKDRLPALADLPFEQSWAGMIDSLPDVVPVLDEASACPGLFIATGLSGHGFGIGPGVGRVMADLIQGKAAGHDLRRFRFERFSDGSPLEVGPTL